MNSNGSWFTHLVGTLQRLLGWWRDHTGASAAITALTVVVLSAITAFILYTSQALIAAPSDLAELGTIKSWGIALLAILIILGAALCLGSAILWVFDMLEQRRDQVRVRRAILQAEVTTAQEISKAIGKGEGANEEARNLLLYLARLQFLRRHVAGSRKRTREQSQLDSRVAAEALPPGPTSHNSATPQTD